MSEAKLDAPAGSQLSEAMMSWSKAWKLDGDLCRCRKCNRGVIVSRAAEAFRHDAECPQAHLISPWQDLRSRIPVNIRLETGSHYWWRQKYECIWRVCYIGIDPDDNQWLHSIGSPPMKITDMDLSYFDWQKINKPNTPIEVQR